MTLDYLQFHKYKNYNFGRCPRVFCSGQPCLPVGQSDVPRSSTVKIYCPRCEDMYHPKSKYQGSILWNALFNTWTPLNYIYLGFWNFGFFSFLSFSFFFFLFFSFLKFWISSVSLLSYIYLLLVAFSFVLVSQIKNKKENVCWSQGLPPVWFNYQ